VRKAFTHAVNRQEMLDSFFNGQGTIISGPLRRELAYNLDVQPVPSILKKQEPSCRRRLQRGADGFMQKDGKRLALTLKVPIEKESEAVKRVVLAFKNYLKNVGADIRVEFKSGRPGRRTSSSSTSSTSSSPYGSLTIRRISRRSSIPARSEHGRTISRILQPGSGRSDQREQVNARP